MLRHAFLFLGLRPVGGGFSFFLFALLDLMVLSFEIVCRDEDGEALRQCCPQPQRSEVLSLLFSEYFHFIQYTHVSILNYCSYFTIGI